MGNQLGGIDLERSGNSHDFGLELNALTTALMEAVHDCLASSDAGDLSLHFDELDQGITVLDESREGCSSV